MSRQTLLCGHQPGFHHPGVLAKRIMQHDRCLSEGLQPSWIIVDQDTGDPGAIRFPDLDDRGRLIERTWHAVAHAPDHPTGTTDWPNALTEPPVVSSAMPESVHRGLHDMHRALQDAEGDTLAERFHDAHERLLQSRLPELVGPPPAILRGTTILETEAGGRILSSILEAPEACTRAWNDAGRLVPGAARALRIDFDDPDRTEVPCWTLDDSGRRMPATVDHLKRHQTGDCVIHPRAFLMTAVIRSTSPHPMIHGMGGERYEQVTDRWAKAFLGIQLPPISVCTADLRLPLEAPDSDTSELDPHEAIRRLEHDPWPAETTKIDLAEAIRLAPRRSPERRRLFDEMQTRLRAARGDLQPRLDALREEAMLQGDRSRQRRVASERTWPWPLYENEAILELELRNSTFPG